MVEEEEEEYEEEMTRFHQLFSSEFNSALCLHPFPILDFGRYFRMQTL